MPPEIRNEIYQLVVPRNETYLVVSPSKAKPETHKTALLRVNKTIYQEGSPYLYINNGFSFGNGRFGSSEDVNLHALKYFFERVPVQHRVLITKAHIHIFLNKWLWEQTRTEVEQMQRSEKTMLTYNGFPDVDDAQNMVSRLMKNLTSLQLVSVKWYNAWRSKKELSSVVGLSPWEVSSGSANAIGSTAILRTLMSYTGQNLTEIRLKRRQALFLRRAMRDMCEEHPGPRDATGATDAPDVEDAAPSDVSPPIARGAGTTIRLYGRHCQIHETGNPKDWHVPCEFAYSEECLADSMVMSDRY
jgi:hypothetical protein